MTAQSLACQQLLLMSPWEPTTAAAAGTESLGPTEHVQKGGSQSGAPRGTRLGTRAGTRPETRTSGPDAASLLSITSTKTEQRSDWKTACHVTSSSSPGGHNHQSVPDTGE